MRRALRFPGVLVGLLALGCTQSASDGAAGAGGAGGSGTGGSASCLAPCGAAGSAGTLGGGAGGSAGGAGGAAGAGGGSGGFAGMGGGSDGGSGGPIERSLPNLALPDEHAWLIDREIWRPLPDQHWDDKCGFWEADSEDLRFPPLTWQACGTGCERAEVLAGLGTVASKPVIRIERGGGVDRAHLRFNHAMVSQSNGSLMAQRMVDLTTGRTIAAVLQAQTVSDGRAWCGASIHVSGSLEFVGFRAIDWEDASSDFQLRGSYDLATQRWLWQLPWPKAVDTSGCHKAVMEAGGRTFYVCPTAIVAALTPGSSERTLVANLYDTGWLSERPSGLGDLIVWPEVYWETGNTRIRGWKPDGEGVRIVADGISLPTCAVALTDRHVKRQ